MCYEGEKECKFSSLASEPLNTNRILSVEEALDIFFNLRVPLSCSEAEANSFCDKDIQPVLPPAEKDGEQELPTTSQKRKKNKTRTYQQRNKRAKRRSEDVQLWLSAQ